MTRSTKKLVEAFKNLGVDVSEWPADLRIVRVNRMGYAEAWRWRFHSRVDSHMSSFGSQWTVREILAEDPKLLGLYTDPWGDVAIVINKKAN